MVFLVTSPFPSSEAILALFVLLVFNAQPPGGWLGVQASQPCPFHATWLTPSLFWARIQKFLAWAQASHLSQPFLHRNHNSFHLFFHPETSIQDPQTDRHLFYANGMILLPMARKAKTKSNASATHFHFLQ